MITLKLKLEFNKNTEENNLCWLGFDRLLLLKKHTEKNYNLTE